MKFTLNFGSDKKRFEEMHRQMRADQKALYAILAKRTVKTNREIRDTCTKELDMSYIANEGALARVLMHTYATSI